MAEPLAVESAAATRANPTGGSLPATGFPVGLAALGAAAVIVAGLTCLAVSRRPA